MDGAEYSDNVFECKSFDIIDSNGNSLQGTADKPSMSVKYSFLLKDQYTPADCISIVNSSMLGQNKLKFTPTKLKMMGLPFITPGDVISYKVDEYSPDEDGNLVDTEKMCIRDRNTDTFVDDSKSRNGKVSVVSSTPYARRLYYHPEYNFSKSENANAGGKWFEPYTPGGKKQDFAEKTFAKLYKKNGGV